MKKTWPLVILLVTILIADPFRLNGAQDDIPQVRIIAPDETKTYTWNEQVRYAISVSDKQDGDSKYGEIPSNECSLSITYLPGNKESDIKELIDREEDPALLLIKRSTCFGCHAHKAKLSGPSFEAIATRYGNDETTIKNISGKILNGSKGTWGDEQMPAHPDLTEEQRRKIAAYILEMGDKPNYWIYPGLEGSFRTIEKPKTDTQGVYVLTAGYTSRSGKDGRHSVVLKVR
jgi:cytochrome c